MKWGEVLQAEEIAQQGTDMGWDGMGQDGAAADIFIKAAANRTSAVAQKTLRTLGPLWTPF